MIEVCRASLELVPGIASLVDVHFRRAEVLPRSAEAIQISIDDWVVAVEGNAVLACGSLLAYSPTLSEIRSLVVADKFKGKGLGRAIVNALIEEAQQRGIATVFALTRAITFFEKAGFRRTHRFRFPEKVWRDCITCSIQDRCDEFAVILSINGHPGPVKRKEKIRNEGDQHD